MTHVIISEKPDPRDDNFDILVLWNAFNKDNTSHIISIPQLVETNSKYLRASFLKWLYDFGRVSIGGKSIIAHLQVREELSYWWLTKLACKSNWANSPQITDAVRFMCFVQGARHKHVSKITLRLDNKILSQCLDAFCKSSGIEFEWKTVTSSFWVSNFAREFLFPICYFFKALAWLPLHVFRRLPLKGVGVREWRSSDATTTFVSYSSSSEGNSYASGEFKSKYWTKLPSRLKAEDHKTNWLHIYVKDRKLPSARLAAKAFERLNVTDATSRCHVTLDSFLSFKVIWNTFKDWFHLIKAYRSLTHTLFHKRVGDVQLIAPFFKEDWKKSFISNLAIYNLLTLNLFESAIKSLPKRCVGFFLQENMAWEFCLINAWRENNHKRLIAVPHTTIRFWDLRYFFDRREFDSDSKLRLPSPDLIACNGPIPRNAILEGGITKDKLVNVEALRYLDLGFPSKKITKSLPQKNKPISILVLGDYLPRNNMLQMKILAQAVVQLQHQVQLIVKPHPNCPITCDDYPFLNFVISNASVIELVASVDIAFASALTTGAVDTYCLGIPTISIVDPKTLNLSPLRDCKGAIFVSSGEELALKISELSQSGVSKIQVQEYFYLHGNLDSWLKLCRP